MTVVINWRNWCLNGRRGGVGAKLFLLREIGAGAALRPREVRDCSSALTGGSRPCASPRFGRSAASFEDDDEDQEGDKKRHR